MSEERKPWADMTLEERKAYYAEREAAERSGEPPEPLPPQDNSDDV